MSKDYYNILNVPRTASQDEIKKAFRKLAHQHHPDKHGGDDLKFKELNEAYQILSDPQKRSNYDNFGFAYNEGGFGGANGYGGQDFSNLWEMFGGRSQSSGGGGFEDIFDIFSDAFGGQGGFQQQYREPTKGEDLYLEINISKKDLGKEKYFEYEIQDACNECSGSGVAKGYKIINCTTCGGSGQVRQTSRSGFGVFTRIVICNKCGGRGQMPEKECSHCKGSGRIKTKKQIEIRIPQDINREYTVIIPKGGNFGSHKKPSGDLIMSLRVK